MISVRHRGGAQSDALGTSVLVVLSRTVSWSYLSWISSCCLSHGNFLQGRAGKLS